MFLLNINSDITEFKSVHDAINALAHHIKANPQWEQDRISIFDQALGTEVFYKSLFNEMKFIDPAHSHWLIDCLLNDFELAA